MLTLPACPIPPRPCSRMYLLEDTLGVQQKYGMSAGERAGCLWLSVAGAMGRASGQHAVCCPLSCCTHAYLGCGPAVGRRPSHCPRPPPSLWVAQSTLLLPSSTEPTTQPPLCLPPGDVLVFAKLADGGFAVCGRKGTSNDVSRKPAVRALASAGLFSCLGSMRVHAKHDLTPSCFKGQIGCMIAHSHRPRC